MYRLRAIAVLSLVLAATSPALARRHRRVAPKPKPKSAPAAVSAPMADVARSVILIIADGYTALDFREARGDGFLAMDHFPVTGVALPPSGLDAYDGASLGRTLGTGQAPGDSHAAVSLLGLARQYGKRIALVSGDSVAGPLPCAMALGGVWGTSDAWQRLIEQRVDVLYGRKPPANAGVASGYAVTEDAETFLKQETTPAMAAVPSGNVPFETLVFRAMHLVAKGPKGFLLAAVARPEHVAAVALDDAVASTLRYAQRDKRTLGVLLYRQGETEILVRAYGPAARKFGGALEATDIPKIVAGVAGLKVFRRDFSPLFLARSAADAPALPALDPVARGIHPLPW